MPICRFASTLKCLAHLLQGPYVLVLVACTGSRRPWLLPAMWCVRAYRGLARPFRKNVRFVVLVQPSMLVRTAMTVVKPFVSKKAHAKLKQVRRQGACWHCVCGSLQPFFLLAT